MNLLHHLFIPSERNNFRAKLLHIDSLSLVLMFFLIITFFTQSTGQIGKVLGVATDITIDKLYELTNQKRGENGLSFLNLSSELSSAACAKANYMFANNLWAHYGSDGTTPWSFILSSGYRYSFAGENLAKDFMFSNDVVQAWMNSPTHRENLLRNDYKDIGFCVANGVIGSQETTLVVQMFGSRQGTTTTRQARAETRSNTTTKKISPTEIIASPTPALVAATIEGIKTPGDLPSFTQARFRFDITLFWSMLFALTLFSDLYVARKLKITRAVGKHVAHLIFIGFAIIGILIITKGTII